MKENGFTCAGPQGRVQVVRVLSALLEGEAVEAGEPCTPGIIVA